MSSCGKLFPDYGHKLAKVVRITKNQFAMTFPRECEPSTTLCPDGSYWTGQIKIVYALGMKIGTRGVLSVRLDYQFSFGFDLIDRWSKEHRP